jgi:long-chain acyl-CoA synthetase
VTINDNPPWQGVYNELGIEAPPLDDRTLGYWVEEHGKSLADNAALQYIDREISYRELDEMSNQLANALTSLGVSKDDVVGIQMPNIPQYPIALVAISKLGYTGSGVSPLLMPGEIVHQIEDAGITTLISFDALANSVLPQLPTIPACLKNVIVAGAADYLAPTEVGIPNLAGVNCVSYLSVVDAASTEFEARSADWNDTWMIQYTGGTTGAPKGAEISVRNIMYNMSQTSAYSPWEIGKEVLATAFPMFHVAGLGITVSAIRHGARMLLIPDPRDIEFFCKQMTRFPPTRLAAVPTLYQMLLDHPLFGNIDFSNLKVAITGAAPLTTTDRERIEAVIGANTLSDLFGMTETGPVHVGSPHKRSKAGSIGIPVPGADTRIVDLETGTEEMPFGEAGEIITSGPHVMKGYLNLPEESAKAMREWRGKTWMYTGDVGYMDDEGYIFLCDRAKDMLIVGGYKVFSVEVEDKLKSLDFIAESAVVGTPNKKRPGNDIVNLYVELKPDEKDRDAEVISKKVQEYCRANMAAYKVPKVIRVIDAIPLTPVGKIDKKVLRAKAQSEVAD